MAIIALKAWYIEQYEPIREVIKQPCTLRLSRNSLLKSGLRADFLDDRNVVEASVWFELYLAHKTVEFYIEGSGTYVISNIDLVSQEIYFTKTESLAGREPIIYYSPQEKYAPAAEAAIATLKTTIDNLNERSRLPLSLEITPRPQNYPLRLSNNQFRKISKSLLFIADITPIAAIPGENKTELLLDANTCVELGYAFHSQDKGQILLLRMEREDLTGEFPFDVANYKQLDFTSEEGLQKTLPNLVKTLLQKFSLF